MKKISTFLTTLFPCKVLSAFLNSQNLIKKAFLFFILLIVTHFAFSQNTDSTKSISHFSGAVTVTTKGISTIPSFTLGKPAVIFDMAMGRKNLSFEPQFRFSLAGKPWSFLFWWRYKLLTTDKFRINVGAHPAISFKSIPVSRNGDSIEVTAAQRYLAGELSPNYILTKNISIGTYYLYSHGFEKGVTKNTHFIALRTNFSNIKLSNNYFMRFAPQFYYLKADKRDGVYFNSTLTLAKRNFPLSISSLVNTAIQSNVPGKNFLWNASLVYAFNKAFIEK